MAIFNQVKKTKIGLCLGGGGARGFAHIGALKAFIEEGISFDMIAGTSVGSLIGGLYAAGVSPLIMEELGEKINLKEVHSGFKPNDPLKIGALVKGVVGEQNIEDLAIPLYIVAVDLVTAREVIIDKGALYEAVSASCAVPLFFRPLIKGDMHLADGGLLNNIPADVLRMMGADKVITVDINPTRGGGTDGIGIFDMIKATLSIVTAGASQNGLINSDIIIAPDLSKFKATKKDGHDQMIALGYEAAKQKMPEIKQLLGIKPTKEQLAENKKQQKQQAIEAKKHQKLQLLELKHQKKQDLLEQKKLKKQEKLLNQPQNQQTLAQSEQENQSAINTVDEQNNK